MSSPTEILSRWHFMHAPFFLTLATFARPSALNFVRLRLAELALSGTNVEHPGILASEATRLRGGLLISMEGMSTAVARGLVSEIE